MSHPAPYWSWAVSLAASLVITPPMVAQPVPPLPANAAVILSVNLHQILDEPLVKRSAEVQQFLDRIRLALKGDEQQLKAYFKRNRKTLPPDETAKEFLEWARQLRAFHQAWGVDTLRDVDWVTCGVVLNEKSLADVAIVIEGRFDPVKFGAATRKDAKAFRSVRIAGFDVWECSIPPPHAQQYYMALLDPRRLVITYTKEGMAEVLRQAGGKARSAPSRGMQLLMTQARQEHIAVVVKPTQVILRILQDELNRQAPFGLGDWVAAFGKYANDIVIMSGGLSFREKALRVQIGLDMKSRAAAKGLGQCIAGGNRAAAFLLGFAAEELPRLYADILRKERVRVKESAVIIEADVPYTFIQKVLQAPWP